MLASFWGKGKPREWIVFFHFMIQQKALRFYRGLGDGIVNIRRISNVVNGESAKFAIVSTINPQHPVVGAYAEVQHRFSQEDVCKFAELCGDNNPLHSDPSFAVNTPYGGTIVHGIFVSSLFSTLFGRLIHGAVYVNQTLSFKRPVHVGALVTARTEIVKAVPKSKGTFITCATTCTLADGSLAVTGEATVLIPPLQSPSN